jgi:hypothetical protein
MSAQAFPRADNLDEPLQRDALAAADVDDDSGDATGRRDDA